MEANKRNSASVPSISRVDTCNQTALSNSSSSSSSASSNNSTVPNRAHSLVIASNRCPDADCLESSNHQDLSCLNNVTSTLLPWDRFSQWLYAICLVTFDIEIGQALEVGISILIFYCSSNLLFHFNFVAQSVYPTNVKLTDREKSNICYLSFPDSNSGCMGDTQFHFRTRLCSTPKNDLNSLHDQYNRKSLLAHQIDSDCLYGYVYFRQVRDRTARRGYFQKSIVFLSRFPFLNLFYETIACVAPQFFEHGHDILKKGEFQPNSVNINVKCTRNCEITNNLYSQFAKTLTIGQLLYLETSI